MHDYGVRKGFAKIFGKRKLPTPKQMDEASGERFAPYRSALAWYCWRALDDAEKVKAVKSVTTLKLGHPF